MCYFPENKFQGNGNMKDHKRKICKNCLTMCHLSVPDQSKEKRSATTAHAELMKEWSHELNNAKVQTHVCS